VTVSQRSSTFRQLSTIHYPLFTILLAFALRTYHLDFQSFWSDEGISLLRSAQPLGQMIEQMPMEHMPGYFFLLHYWLELVGTNDFAVRFLSLWPSVLAIAIAYRLAADMGNRRAGLWAGLLLATNGFQVWYAQEARMYSWLLALSLLATWLLWRAITRPPSSLLWIGYTLAVTANIYTHFYGFLTPLAHIVFMILWLIARRNWQQFLRWTVAGLGVIILFLPWLPRAMQISEFSGWRAPIDPSVIPWQYLTAYTVGDTMPAPWHDWLPGLYLLLIIAGFIGWWIHQKRAATLLLITIVIPWIAVIALALRNPDFHERYAIVSGGWLFQKKARFLSLQDILPLIILAPLLYFNMLGLQKLYDDTALHKPNFRDAAQRIQQNERPGDVILVDGPDPEKVFLHYYDGPNEVHDLRFLEGTTGETVDNYLAEVTAEARANGNRIWELLYFHYPGPVQVWTATRAWTTPATYHNDIRVTLYGLTDSPMLDYPLNVNFGPALLLEQVEVNTIKPRPGQLFYVTTRWHTIEQAAEYKFSLRLWDVNGEAVLIHDYVPQNGFAPTNVWWVGHPAADQRGLLSMIRQVACL